MQDEGRSFSIQALGMEMGKMHFGATINLHGSYRYLDSSKGQSMRTEILTDQPGTYGMTQGMVFTVRFEDLKIDLLLMVERIEGTPCLLIHAGIRNWGDRPISLNQLRMIDFPKADATTTGASWAGKGAWRIGFLQGSDYTIARTFVGLQKNDKIAEPFAVYRKDGTGVS